VVAVAAFEIEEDRLQVAVAVERFRELADEDGPEGAFGGPADGEGEGSRYRHRLRLVDVGENYRAALIAAVEEQHFGAQFSAGLVVGQGGPANQSAGAH
jgi:hypothetical protein